MRGILVGAVWVATSMMIAGSAGPSGQSAGSEGRAAVVLDNGRVRIFKTMRGTSRAGVEHKAGVVIPLEDGPTWKAGAAYWAADAAVRAEPGDPNTGSLVIVEPKDTGAASPPPAGAGSKPGDAPFTGMSFKPLFDNEKVAVIRARMEVDAREGLHTHRSDTIVVHLSGGAIEDTANGTTKVNHWKRGDVELEARGSSHAARNVGPAIDVVLVALKP